MEKLYIALVDTPGFFAWLIRKVIKLNYIHVVLSLDPEFQEAYSVGRRNPYIPVFAGFERENCRQIAGAFPTAGYRIVGLECTVEQKTEITRRLRECYEHRFRYHYCILGLPFILMNRPFFQKGHYTCSSFISRLLEVCGIQLFEKHFSLVTPRDFYELQQTEVLYEGKLIDFLKDQSGRQTMGVVYEQ